jgi:hypothetical protein
MRRYTTAIGIVLLALAVKAPPATAQRVAFPQKFDLLSDMNASQTRDQLGRLLERYPPTVTRVLQTDPALLENKDYLSPYPALLAFVSEHPEIMHNAGYFLGNPKATVVYERNPTVIPFRGEDLVIGFVLTAIISGVTWIVRSLIEYRRWAQTIKTQTDIHSRLMDRLTSNDDLLAYIQSPAGRRFLESAPAMGMNAAGPTLNRVLWSVQAGLVVTLAGIGLSYASDHISVEVSQPFFVLGILAIAIGGGFILSALASYMIARNMGLIRGTSETPPT